MLEAMSKKTRNLILEITDENFNSIFEILKPGINTFSDVKICDSGFKNICLPIEGTDIELIIVSRSLNVEIRDKT